MIAIVIAIETFFSTSGAWAEARAQQREPTREASNNKTEHDAFF